MGTLSDDWVGGMKLAAKKAVELGKPWVLDPVGCGATPYRSQARTAALSASAALPLLLPLWAAAAVAS